MDIKDAKAAWKKGKKEDKDKKFNDLAEKLKKLENDVADEFEELE